MRNTVGLPWAEAAIVSAAYVQVLHDQLAGTGVHATSVTITQEIGSNARFEPAAIAREYLELDNQPETEWQPELVI